jgi:acetylglutamate kinase
VKGVLQNIENPESLISVISREEVPTMMTEGILQGGMIPKVECAVNALERGVRTVHIIDGRQPHAILLELFTDGGIGTMII